MSHFSGAGLIGIFLLTGLSGAPVSVFATGPSANIDQLILQFNADDGRRAQAHVAGDALTDLRLPDGRGVTFLRNFGADGMVVKLPQAVDMNEAQQICDQMSAARGLAAVIPDKRYVRAFTPNDPSYPTVFNSAGQWYLFEATAGIRMPQAWDLATGSSSVVVAVVDTGIVPHRDLNSARVLPGYDFISNTFTANDGGGRDNDPTDPGDWAAVGDPCYAADPLKDNSSWHGSSVAGIITATTNNSQDIAGIDFAARLLPVRVLGKCGGSLSDVADAIRWAAGLAVSGVPANPNPADVINLSLSGDGACSVAEQSAIDAAVAAGAVVVTAAGNEAGNVALVSPANCNNVISVGAIGRSGAIASYSNFGLNVDLTAPGGDNLDGVLTLSNLGTTAAAGDALVLITGTSFTTAQASAVASLMLSVNPGLTPALLEDVMKASTRAFPDASCDPSLCGSGVLDAAAALTGAANPSAIAANLAPSAAAGGPYSGVDGDMVTFDGSASSDPESAALSYSWDFGDNSFGSGVSPVHSYSAPGTYTASLMVNDGSRDSTPASATVSISASGNKAVNIDTGGGGGGGCALRTGTSVRFDPVWWLMLVLSMCALRRRSLRR